eukprot:6678477-Lingulodinium_polyedra.AAC.1
MQLVLLLLLPALVPPSPPPGTRARGPTAFGVPAHGWPRRRSARCPADEGLRRGRLLQPAS